MLRLLYGVVRRGIRAGPVCRRQTPGRDAFTAPVACSSGTLVPIGTSTARSSLSLSLSLSSHSLFSLSSSYLPASLLEGRETYVETSTPLSLTEDWSVDVKHNESHKFTLGDQTYLTITQVSLVQEVKNGGKGVVGDFSVWWGISNVEDPIEEILATLSSEHPSEEITDLVLFPDNTYYLSHGWKEGTVQIRGFMETFPECPEKPELTFLTPTTNEEEHVNFADCIPVFEEGSWEWSVVVNPNERLKYTVEDDTFIRITRAALVENGGEGGVVEEFNVYCTITDDYGSEKRLVAILSSEHPEQLLTGCALAPADVVEFFYGRRDVGAIVHIHGQINKLAARKLQADESSGESPMKLSPPSSGSGATKHRKTAASKPTTEDCMEIVASFPGFEVGSSGFTQALLLFFLNESARVDFMDQKTCTSKMEFLKARLYQS